jgi:hypothetical protein
MADLFGFTIKRNKKDAAERKDDSFVAPLDNEDGGYIVDTGAAAYGQYVDLNGMEAASERELILKYRNISNQTECNAAIEEIVNESIVNDIGTGISLVIESEEIGNKGKKVIQEEFDTIVKLLNFNWDGQDIFKRWYVDGRLPYHKIIDSNNPKSGLKEVRYIDPIFIRKVKEVKKKTDPTSNSEIVVGVDEYFLYEKEGIGGTNNTTALKISPDSICYITSGVLDAKRTRVLSHLHKALKPANQLDMLESSQVIYRLSRAPERRIFYIDVGSLPTKKAQEYVQSIMNKYRNKIVYDAETGEVKDNKQHMNMLEDFWLPRREGGKGTEISTLPGGTAMGDIDDILYFQKKLYKSMNVPLARLNSEDSAMVSLGRASETTREELKFQKFIDRIRKKFSELFIDLLKSQLLLKGLISPREWEDLNQGIYIKFDSDTFFSEMKESELLRERVATLREVDEYVGKYYSKEWVRKNILMQTEEEIEIIDKEIEEEGPDEDDAFGLESTEAELGKAALFESEIELMQNMNDFLTNEK